MTDDYYDSDECNYENNNYELPSWSTDQGFGKTQLVMTDVGEKIINTFFSRKIHASNLQEIFETIDPGKLKQTSSALWDFYLNICFFNCAIYFFIQW